ncbi:hypothetical protein GCQ56_07865 [Marinifilum sp. N1E240]|uniref:hypothetical protein n=1 Tax=Marinifilum sp. N1E240 TaxID=2608082 RepID=UPI00128D9B6E|nr:hypothetical protein [Marinifilum sp. N1E240]MPQ46930.1 hypothetical protein [Marinifilum sp. N1E240]
MSNKTYAEKTAAETKSIGFDYQYYFFLWKVISLSPSESVGLEVKDDVHCDLNNDYVLLYQLKHTIKRKADNSPANLTTSDLDMWKTLSNWSKMITDENDGRANKQAQLDFIKKVSFVLASNKSSNTSNKVINNIKDLQKGRKKVADVRSFFNNLKRSTKDDDLKGYVSDVNNMEGAVLEKFLMHTYFHLDDDDLIKKCKSAIKSKMIPLNKINDCFALLDSSIRADNFLNIKNGEKIEITFDNFYKKYRRCFDTYRNENLNIRQYNGILPDNLEDQVFIKQLKEIGFVEQDDFELISELSRFKIKLLDNLENWKQEGDVTQDELLRLKNDALNIWNREFRFKYLGNVSEEEYNIKGIELLQIILRNNLKLGEQELDVDLSNGRYYSLSDEPVIGWRKDWKKYKK